MLTQSCQPQKITCTFPCHSGMQVVMQRCTLKHDANEAGGAWLMRRGHDTGQAIHDFQLAWATKKNVNGRGGCARPVSGGIRCVDIRDSCRRWVGGDSSCQICGGGMVIDGGNKSWEITPQLGNWETAGGCVPEVYVS